MTFEQRLHTRLLTVFLLIMICITMSGCGIVDAFVSGVKLLIGVPLLSVGAILCFWSAVTVAPAVLKGRRGTNSFTRFVRDANMNAKLNRKYAYLVVSVPLLAFGGMLVLGSLGGLLCIIPISIIIVVVVFMHKSNNDEQRKKDARVVTKAGAKVTAKVATPVAAVAATAVGGPAATAAVLAAGAAVTDIADSVDQNMTDVQVNGFEMERTVKALQSTPMKGDPNLMLEKAAHLGIATNGRSIDEIANEVIALAPAATLKGLPDNMAAGDKAMAILSAFQSAQPTNARG